MEENDKPCILCMLRSTYINWFIRQYYLYLNCLYMIDVAVIVSKELGSGLFLIGDEKTEQFHLKYQSMWHFLFNVMVDTPMHGNRGNKYFFFLQSWSMIGLISSFEGKQYAMRVTFSFMICLFKHRLWQKLHILLLKVNKYPRLYKPIIFVRQPLLPIYMQ